MPETLAPDLEPTLPPFIPLEELVDILEKKRAAEAGTTNLLHESFDNAEQLLASLANNNKQLEPEEITCILSSKNKETFAIALKGLILRKYCGMSNNLVKLVSEAPLFAVRAIKRIKEGNVAPFTEEEALLLLGALENSETELNAYLQSRQRIKKTTTHFIIDNILDTYAATYPSYSVQEKLEKPKLKKFGDTALRLTQNAIRSYLINQK